MPLEGSVTLFGSGTTFGAYRIVRALGEGGMGTVYEAVHTRLNKRVALKTLHKQFAMNAEATERFVREGKAAARLRHAHAVDVADVAIENGTPYLVMEFLEGEDFSKLIARSAPLPPEQLVEIMLPVCAAIAAAHDEGIVHRDLKPENIFLARPKQGGLHPKVLDFGISKVVDNDGRELTKASSVLGSPFYMSPEHAHGARYVDAKSDEYSLGVILYEALTHRRPIEKETLFAQLDAILEETPIPPRVIRPEIPESLERIVLRAMEKDPSKRFDSVLDLGRALLPFGSDRVRAVWEPTFGSATVEAPPPVEAPALPSTTPIPPTIEAALPDTLLADGEALYTPNLGSTTLGASITRVVPYPEHPRQTPRFIAPAAIALVLIGGAALAWRLNGSTQTNASVRPPAIVATPSRAFRANVTVSPPTASITVDDAPAGTGSMNAEFAANGATHWLRVNAPGYEPFAVSFRDGPPVAHVELRPVARPVPAIAPQSAIAVPSQVSNSAPNTPVVAVSHPVATQALGTTHTRSHQVTTHRPNSNPTQQTHRPANGSRIVY